MEVKKKRHAILNIKEIKIVNNGEKKNQVSSSVGPLNIWQSIMNLAVVFTSRRFLSFGWIASKFENIPSIDTELAGQNNKYVILNSF